MDDLGRLSPVDDLRKAWPKEQADFTPWLAEKNLDLLSETLGIDLEVHSTEVSVGGFRADIVATNTADGTKVVIENQLGDSDHDHIGKAITYAAGSSASTVVWIAKRMRDEHRAALDWLNKATNLDTSFFGIEVKLWKIGKSKTAPQFVIVSQPNDWDGPIPPPGGNRVYLDYWRGVADALVDNGSGVRPTTPKPVAFAFYPIGKAFFKLRASFTTLNKELQVALLIWGDNAQAFGEMLYDQSEEIHRELRHPLKWTLPPTRKSTVISLTRTGVDPSDKEDWRKQFGWFVENLNAFNDVFRERVKKLDINNYVPTTPDPDDIGDEDET